jgi:hypothetical protein
MHYTVCIDPKTHLPLRIMMGSGSVVTTYSDWNAPIQIDPPKM